MHKANITIVILTKNEARNLPRCLEAIPNQYPIVILDSGSIDETISIATEHGCGIRKHKWPGFADQRNFALNDCNINTEWILFIDVDEIFTNQFYDWLKDAICRNDFDVAMIPSQLVFDGKPLRHAPGYPIYHPRLVRHSVTFVPSYTGHGEAVSDPVRIIKAPYGYKHYFFDGNYYAWALKHVALAEKERIVKISNGRNVTLRSRVSALIGKNPFRFIIRFIYHYVVCRGFLDGRAGLNYSIMYSWFEFTRFLSWRSRWNDEGR